MSRVPASPRANIQLTTGMTGKGQQVQNGQHSRKVPLSVAEVLFQVIALGFQHIECLVLDFPPHLPQAAIRTTLPQQTGRSVLKLLRYLLAVFTSNGANYQERGDPKLMRAVRRRKARNSYKG